MNRSDFLACRYCDTINSMVHVMQQRQIQPKYQHDWTFSFTKLGRDYTKALKTLKTFTKKVIGEKRAQFDDIKDTPKGRVAFLDLLMKAELPDGSKLNDDDIQEEVDTFMFEGEVWDFS